MPVNYKCNKQQYCKMQQRLFDLGFAWANSDAPTKFKVFNDIVRINKEYLVICIAKNKTITYSEIEFFVDDVKQYPSQEELLADLVALMLEK